VLMPGQPGLDAALPAELTPQALPFGFTFTDFSQLNMFPRARRDRWGGTWKLKSFVNPGKTLKFREEPYELVSRRRESRSSSYRVPSKRNFL